MLLLFANSVSQQMSPTVLAGRVLALAGLGAAFASTFWCWGYTRLSVRLGRRDASAADAAAKALGALRIGLAINLAGMGVSILGAEAIIGTLAAKSLTTGAGAIVAAPPGGMVQALDMLIVQANTNTVAAHFVGLCVSLRIRGAAEAAAAVGDAA